MNTSPDSPADPSMPTRTPVPADALPAGTKIRGGAYRIVRVIGRGGFSIVYEGRNERGESVAIKELFPQEARRKRFLGLWTRKQVRQTRDWADLLELIRREFKVVRGLRHPNIVRVVELISENDTLYLVMEYLPGRTLQEHLRCHTRPEQPGLSESDGVIVAAALGDALAYAHSKGIVHRDVKPSNVLVGNDGRIVLLDFGIARQRQRGEGRSRVGTESYMAPEQLDGATQTRLVDVYGLGATLYHLLTGQAPASVVQQRRGERLIPPRELAPHLSEHAEAALLRALQHDPTLRTPSTTALADALRGIPVALADFDEQQDRQRSLHFTLLIVLAAVLFAVAGWLVVPR